jgi:hypothetical protein
VHGPVDDSHLHADKSHVAERENRPRTKTSQHLLAQASVVLVVSADAGRPPQSSLIRAAADKRSFARRVLAIDEFAISLKPTEWVHCPSSSLSPLLVTRLLGPPSLGAESGAQPAAQTDAATQQHKE